jgi:AcrR family transcriptional regulator
MATSVPLRERKKAATKERLYLEAIELFRRKGIAATTVDDIAAAAEVSKGTFFNYFPTKESVLHYFGEQQTLAVADEIADALQDTKLDTRQKLRLLFRALAKNVEADREVTRVVVFEVMKSPAELAREPYRALFKQTVSELVAAGQKRNEVRAGLNPDLAGSALVGVYFQQIFEWCAADKPFPLAKRLDQMLDVIWDGLRAKSDVG